MRRILRWIVHNVPIRFERHRSTVIRPYGGITMDVYCVNELTAKLTAAQEKLRERQ